MNVRNMIFATAVALSAVSCITEEESSAPSGSRMKPGDRLPAFTAVTTTGDTCTDESFRGKTSVIVFFNTGCGDCRKELPILQRIYEKYGEDDDFKMLCISRNENAEDIESYWTENSLTLPYSPQTNNNLYNSFAYSNIPQIYISDSTCTIKAIYLDKPLAEYEDLAGWIDSLM